MRRNLLRRGVVGAVATILVMTTIPGGAVESSTADLNIRSSRTQYTIGDRLDWTVDWTKKSAGTSAEQVVVDLSGQHEFVNGSVEVPRGWSVEYSQDGETYTDVPDDLVSHLRFTNDAVTQGGIRVSLPIPRPIPPIVTAQNGGDGYVPMLAGDRVYAIWHHLPATGTPAASVVCIDTLTGKSCVGYPKKLGMQTSFNQGQGIFLRNRLYFKNRDATTHGVMCWSMTTESSCGYEPIATLGPVTGTAGGDGGWDQFSSPVLHDGRLYFAAHNHRVYCFDPAKDAICEGYTLAGKAMARASERHITTRLLNDVVEHDGRLYFSLANSWADSPIPLGTKVECFDLDAGVPCVGFGTGGVVSESAATAYMFTRRDSSGVPVGFCLGVQSGAGDLPIQPTVPCYDYDGATRTTMTSQVPFAQFRPYNVEEATIGARTFFGRYSINGGYCYDWSTSAPCAGANFDANGRSTRTTAEHFYGFAARGECMVGLGHRGIFMSIDPLTGATPCQQVTDLNHIASAESRYCRDTTSMGQWNSLRSVDVKGSDFSRLDVSVSDSATSVAGSLLSGALSIAPLRTSDRIAVRLTATVNVGTDPWKSATPTVDLTFDGAHQFCFQTVVKPAPVKELDAVIEVTTDEGEARETVSPDPLIVSNGSLIPLLPTLGADSANIVLVALALIAAGGVLVVRRRVVGLRQSDESGV